MAEYYTSETGRALPARFQSDIDSKVLHMVCRVIIESPTNIYISTHKMNFDGNYYKPLLLKNPIIKQSVGLEDGKFKISTVNLSISNFEYEGEIFSDILKDVSLINTKARIFFQTQTAQTSDDTLEVYVGEIRKIQHTSSSVDITIEDYTQHKTNIQLPKEVVDSPSADLAHIEKYRGKPIPMVYGHVLKAPAVIDVGGIIKADYDEVELVTNRAGDYETIGNDYFYSNVQNEVFDNEVIHPMWIYSGSSYINIMLTGKQDLPHTRAALGLNELGIFENFIGVQQYRDEGNGRLSFQPNFLLQHNVVQGVWYGKGGKVSLTKRSSGGVSYTGDYIDGFDNPDNFGEDINRQLSDANYDIVSILDSNGFEPNHTWTYNYIDYFGAYTMGYVNQNLMRLRIETKPNYNGYGFNSQIAINGHRMPFLVDIQSMPYNNPLHVLGKGGQNNFERIASGSLYNQLNAVSLNGGAGSASYYSVESDDSEWRLDKIFSFPDFVDSPDYAGDYDLDDFSSLIQFDDTSWDSGGAGDLSEHLLPYILMWNNTRAGYFDIYFGLHSFEPEGDAGDYFTDITARLKGNFSEIDLKSIIDVKDALTSNIYLNIDGRRGGNGVRLSNAIEILNDIAISEMNVTDIDSNSYDDAKDNNNIKLAFSVNEFINAKELFEDISRSTMCFPYFKSNGQLGFPTIKNSYSFDDYKDSFSINHKDIIKYSFSKTPSEKVYTRVDVKYKIDYETKEYLSRISDSYGKGSNEGITALSLDEQQLEYYGYDDSEENLLEFESKYIRELDSARELADKLFHYHRNQHLKAKLKLPLKYIAIEVGSIISFNELIEGRLAYGINYCKVDNPFGQGGALSRGGQYFYPLFFVNSVNISYDYIEIEATQLHWLEEGIGAVNDVNNWIANDLYLFSEDEPPEEDIGGEDLEIDPFDYLGPFIINIEGLNAFQTTHSYPTITNLDILNWFEPSAFGLNSFDELLPNDWSSYTTSQIRDYKAVEFSIACGSDTDPTTHYQAIVALENISGSTHIENFELGWKVQFFLDGDIQAHEYNEENWFNNEFLYISSYANDYGIPSINTLQLGDGLKKAINEGLISFEDLTFSAANNIIGATYGYGLGDVNGDGTMNILDIVQTTNHILAPEGYSPLDSLGVASADYNQDSVVNILDIIQMANALLGNE